MSWTPKQVGDITADDPGRSLYLWGSNSRAESARAKKLGWNPHGSSFWAQLPEDVKVAVEKATGKA